MNSLGQTDGFAATTWQKQNLCQVTVADPSPEPLGFPAAAISVKNKKTLGVGLPPSVWIRFSGLRDKFHNLFIIHVWLEGHYDQPIGFVQ